MNPFHLAFPVKDLESTRKFYGEIFALEEGRSCEDWIDWNFFGHQISTHVKPNECAIVDFNQVDGKNVPVRHFGAILKWQEWHDLADKLRSRADKGEIKFIVDPYIRFRGATGEQATMFLLDFSGNALEFKSFKDMTQIFKKYD